MYHNPLRVKHCENCKRVIEREENQNNYQYMRTSYCKICRPLMKNKNNSAIFKKKGTAL